MKCLPWASWKFWNRIPAWPRRRIHLGIDYGTSASKIVFRDSAAPGGEGAVLVLRKRMVRIPSRVCMTATDVLFDRKNALGILSSRYHRPDLIELRASGECDSRAIRRNGSTCDKLVSPQIFRTTEQSKSYVRSLENTLILFKMVGTFPTAPNIAPASLVLSVG